MEGEVDAGTYPFTVPVLASFTSLDITTPVTFFVGENGSGKSTSPLLLAYTGARILSFDDGALVEADYGEFPHVTLTKSFLENPERYLRQL